MWVSELLSPRLRPDNPTPLRPMGPGGVGTPEPTPTGTVRSQVPRHWASRHLAYTVFFVLVGLNSDTPWDARGPTHRS